MEAAKYPFGKVIAGARSVHFNGLWQKESIPYTEIQDVSVSRFFKRITVESSQGRTSATLWSLQEAMLLAKVIRQNVGLDPPDPPGPAAQPEDDVAPAEMRIFPPGPATSG
jgi:hypothetical protein